MRKYLKGLLLNYFSVSDTQETYLFIFVCVSDQTEAKGPRSEGIHQPEVEETTRWKGLPQGRGGDKEEELKN